MSEKFLGKINKLLQTHLAEIFLQESFRWFPGAFIVVTRASITSDLSYARVYLSIMNPDKKKIIELCNKEHKGEIKKILGAKIRNKIRRMPELHFILDDTLDYIEEIDRLLKKK